MWIDNQIRDDAGGGEGHSLRGDKVTDDSFLAVPASELIP